VADSLWAGIPWNLCVQRNPLIPTLIYEVMWPCEYIAVALPCPVPPPSSSHTNMPSNTDNITLVAPRPVRLANFSIHLPSPHRRHSLRVDPLDDDHLDPDSLSPKSSPRASPRSAPPSRLHPCYSLNLSHQVHLTLRSTGGVPFYPQTLSFPSPLPYSPPSAIPHLCLP
jgi:hypothetical protein